MDIKKHKIRIISIALFIVFGGFGVIKLFYAAISNQERLSYNSPSAYNNLFTAAANPKVQLFATITSRTRHPESEYVCNKKYNLFITRFNIRDDFGLQKNLNVENEETHLDKSKEVSLPLKSFDFKLAILSEKIPTATNVVLKIGGSNVKVITDSTNKKFYYIRSKTFSVALNSTIDYLFSESVKENPACVAFIKKDKFLYMVIMTVATGKEEMTPIQLDEILN